MKANLLQLLLCSAGLALAGAALADGAASAPCAISTHIADDGSVKLSNPEDPSCDAPAAPPTAATATKRVTTPAAAPDSAVVSTRNSGRPLDANADAAPADAASAAADAPKDPRERYRDTVMAGTQSVGSGNPAVSRRYKAMDKATYQDKVLGGVPPESRIDGQQSGSSLQ